MPDPSKPVPLEAEAIEAAAKTLAYAIRDWVHESPLSRCSMGTDTCASWPVVDEIMEKVRPKLPAAILAADEARGMKVEWSGIAPNVGRLRFFSEGEVRQHVKVSPHTELEQRMVSDWFPIKGPVDE